MAAGRRRFAQRTQRTQRREEVVGGAPPRSGSGLGDFGERPAAQREVSASPFSSASLRETRWIAGAACAGCLDFARHERPLDFARGERPPRLRSGRTGWGKWSFRLVGFGGAGRQRTGREVDRATGAAPALALREGRRFLRGLRVAGGAGPFRRSHLCRSWPGTGVAARVRAGLCSHRDEADGSHDPVLAR